MINYGYSVVVPVSDLEQKVYSFSLGCYAETNHKICLMLERYSEEIRETKRHKFIAVKSFHRLDNRGYNRIGREEIVIPDSVKKEVFDDFMKQIKFEDAI